jgi:predicted subunit of tRNA(5-methylaminomethyl-2-thiouridylate) methyltransferase
MSGDEAVVLYSGGKDSSLAAHLLGRAGFEVTLATVSFGVTDAWRNAEGAAAALGLPHRRVALDRGLLDEACERIAADRRPREGILMLHRAAVEAAAGEAAVVADGTRRDDVTPRLTPAEMRSLEDRRGVEYCAPLLGLGYRTIRRLASRLFVYEEGPAVPSGDYEREVRARLAELGHDTAPLFPPDHAQSRVIGWRNGNG